MSRRVAVYAGLVAMLVAMLGPPLLWPSHDSYPLSTYPMFAADRGRTSAVTAVVGIGADGEVHRLSAREVTGTDEVMLAIEQVARAVRDGFAQRLGAADLDRPDVDTVEVRTEWVDSVRWLDGDREPSTLTVQARCPA